MAGVTLVCPVCRQPEPDGSLPVVLLARRPGSDSCGRCGAVWPKVDGISCISPDLDAFALSQALALDLAWPPRGTAEALRLCKEAGDDPEAALPAQYALAHFPEAVTDAALVDSLDLRGNGGLISRVRGWLAGALGRGAIPGHALEVGCGPGGLLETVGAPFVGGVVGFDVRLSMLRVARRLLGEGAVTLPFRAEGRRFVPIELRREPASVPINFVQGDLVAPPLEAESFPLVCAMSLIDTVPDPVFAVGQLDALTAPGGLLLLGAPWHWEPRVTHPGAWWSTAQSTADDVLRAALRGEHPDLPHLRYELLDQATETWSIPGHARVTHRYRVELTLARKRA